MGEFSLEKANEWGSKETNRFVQKIAELKDFKGDDLQDAIRFMENNYGIPVDSANNDFGGGLQHNLRDVSHHFSIGGLVCSLFTQFTGKAIGTDSNGALKFVDVSDKTLIGKILKRKYFMEL